MQTHAGRAHPSCERVTSRSAGYDCVNNATIRKGRVWLPKHYRFETPRSRGVGTLRDGRPADYLPPGTVGQWPPATGRPKNRPSDKGDDSDPGLASRRDCVLTANACRPEAVGWAPLVCAGPLTTSLRGLWVSGLLPPGNGGTSSRGGDPRTDQVTQGADS